MSMIRALIVAATGLLAGTAIAADTTPFYRIGDPNIYDVGVIAQQYVVNKPREATSYRFVNPCSVDVRIRKVDTMDDKVTLTTGTRFLARSVETIATSAPKIVSLIAHADPGQAGCKVELQYGTGN